MSKSKKPPVLGLNLTVRHPASMDYRDWPHGPASRWGSSDDEGKKVRWPPTDPDGHYVFFESVALRRSWEPIAEVTIRQNVSPRPAANLLRKLADLIERRGSRLLALEPGIYGDISADGDISDEEIDELLDDVERQRCESDPHEARQSDAAPQEFEPEVLRRPDIPMEDAAAHQAQAQTLQTTNA